MSTNKQLNFLNYINKPMSREGIAIVYSANNIKFERCELYGDFIQSLILLIFDTYLGDKLTDGEQQVNHFKWCWNKNIDNFKKEGITLESKKLYDYFLGFMLEVYYPLTKKNENPNTHKNILTLWSYLFDYNNQKTNSDIDTFVEVYKMFEKSLKTNKNTSNY